MRFFLFLCFLKLTPFLFAQSEEEKSGYIGAKQCALCHLKQYEEWKASDHSHSMSEANARTVLGDFENRSLRFHNIQSRLFKRDGNYFVQTLNGEGKEELFHIAYTFGHYPLQQYLVEMKRGHYQALNTAWDSRISTMGGQRWYHLRDKESISPEHTFFWSRHFQNWNSRCSECHSTNVQKNYNASKDFFKTKWSEINVSCEACHGPGKKHRELVASQKYSKNQTGFARKLPQAGAWGRFGKTKTFLGEKSDIEQIQKETLNMCGACHSLRTSLSAWDSNKDYHNRYKLRLLESDHYHVDGQIKGEVFVMGSFLQSKMYKEGVTCANCHNSHTGKVHTKTNALCTQCHSPQVYDVQTHHHHKGGSLGAQCVECHMPATTYMGVDARRDHRFGIPRPDLTLELGIPNACQSCHAEKTQEWTQKHWMQWYGEKRSKHATQEKWARTHAQLQRLNPLAVKPVVDLLKSKNLSAIQEATLLSQLKSFALTEFSIQEISKRLEHKDPLVRRGAVSALQFASVELRKKHLISKIEDPSLSVRCEVVSVLVDILNSFSDTEKVKVQKGIEEYREVLNFNSDSPANLASLGTLEMSLGHRELAETHYEKALSIEPNYVPAVVNLADLYRASGRDLQGGALLEKGLKLVPESSVLHHAYGLHCIRMKKYDLALQYLKEATKHEESSPRHVYIYALALKSLGKVEEAIRVLEKETMKWPNQFELLNLLVELLERQGSYDKAKGYRKQISDLRKELSKL